jgi:UDP-glucose 4-epimerase
MILITGARGFIGSNLAALLTRQGEEVIPLVRGDSFCANATGISLDLTSEDHLKQLKARDLRPDTVIHLAGHIEIALQANHDDPSLPPVPGPENLSAIYRSNLLATVNLIEYCRDTGVKHFIFASSQAVYGQPLSEAVTEETPCNPLEHYAQSKACCESILKLAASDSMAVTVFRFPGIYSEKRRKGTVIRFCQAAIEKGLISVTADLPLPFDVLHLDDVLDAFCRAIRTAPRGYEIYNISTGEPNSLTLLADRIAALVPGCRTEHPACQQPVIRLDPAKARAKLGWTAAPSAIRLQQVLDSFYHD